MRTTTLSTILAFALAGCTGMMIGDGAMHDAIDDANAENERHQAVGRLAEALPPLIDDTVLHAATMGAILDGMHGPMGSMLHCTGIDDMIGMRGAMHGELDSHATAMHAAADLGWARAEVERHGGAMGVMLGDMTMMLGDMDCGTW